MAVIHDVMPAFELFQPGSIGDAVALLNRYGASAWVITASLCAMSTRFAIPKSSTLTTS